MDDAFDPSDDAGRQPKVSSARDVLRQKKEVEEKRKFGLAPLAVDVVTHQEISPNVPEEILNAPWYYGAGGPTLDHQRLRNTEELAYQLTLLDDGKVDRAVVTGKASGFSAGACQNCGSRTHKANQCYKAKKKVGAVHSGVVTGADVHVERHSDKTYAQKRDRYAGGVSVDLLRAVPEEEGVTVDAADRKAGGGPAKQQRAEQVFSAQSAVHCGGREEIRELPKYLINLDSTTYFDPKTGSMRGDPNQVSVGGASVSSFQGDLARYRTGGYYDYLDMQSRFLTGESRSFVDFELDSKLYEEKQRQLQKEQEAQRIALLLSAQASADTNMEGQHTMPGEFASFDEEEEGDGDAVHMAAGSAAELARSKPTASAITHTPVPDRGLPSAPIPLPVGPSRDAASMVSAPLAVTTQTSITGSMYRGETVGVKQDYHAVKLPSTGDRQAVGDALKTAGIAPEAVLQSQGLQRDKVPENHLESLRCLREEVRIGTRQGHAAVFGSYFDITTFQWGYRCCRRLGKDANPCVEAATP